MYRLVASIPSLLCTNVWHDVVGCQSSCCHLFLLHLILGGSTKEQIVFPIGLLLLTMIVLFNNSTIKRTSSSEASQVHQYPVALSCTDLWVEQHIPCWYHTYNRLARKLLLWTVTMILTYLYCSYQAYYDSLLNLLSEICVFVCKAITHHVFICSYIH